MGYSGVGTALVTPRNTRGHINIPRYISLLERQVQAGIDFVVVLGTTGEAEFLPKHDSSGAIVPTDRDYRKELVRETVATLLAMGKEQQVPVVVGASAIDPEEVIERTLSAQKLLVDAVLITPPPYVKPRQNGIVNHYETIAKAVGNFPLIAYNVPGRVGVNIEPETLRLLMRIPSVMGIKEASGNMKQMEAYARVRREEGHDGLEENYFHIWSGDDATAFQAVQKFGADGVISVVSNVAPKRMKDVIHAAFEEDEQGSSLDQALQPLYAASMRAGNPQSIKYMMERAGLKVGLPHSSLGTPTKEEREVIDSLVQQAGELR